MKLRISGTQAECAAAVTALAVGFELREVSGFYPNRGGSALGRVYVDAVPSEPADGRVRATATRDDDTPNDGFVRAVEGPRRGLPGGAR